MSDLSHNRYQEAEQYEDIRTVREDIEAVFQKWDDGDLSRPGLAEELRETIEEFHRYAKHTER